MNLETSTFNRDGNVRFGCNIDSEILGLPRLPKGLQRPIDIERIEVREQNEQRVARKRRRHEGQVIRNYLEFNKVMVSLGERAVTG